MMSTKTYIPEHYAPLLNLYDTQKAIGLLKRVFEDTLCGSLHLRRVSRAPVCGGLLRPQRRLKRRGAAGLPLTFPPPGGRPRWSTPWPSGSAWPCTTTTSRWGEGLVTDMNAIRRDEIPDNLHSIYVDQWDWEKVIAPRDRNLDYLKHTVEAIVCAMADTQKTLRSVFPQLSVLPQVHKAVSFVTTQELEDAFPTSPPRSGRTPG